jgi:hypothetical protein
MSSPAPISRGARRDRPAARHVHGQPGRKLSDLAITALVLLVPSGGFMLLIERFLKAGMLAWGS